MKYKIKDTKGKLLPGAFLRQDGKVYYKDNSLLICDEMEVKGATIHFYTGYQDCKGNDLFDGDVVTSMDGCDATVRILKDMGVVIDTGKGIYPFKQVVTKLTLKDKNEEDFLHQ